MDTPPSFTSTWIGMGWIGRPARVVLQAGPTGRVQEAGGRTRPTRLPGEAPVGGTVNIPEIFQTGVNKNGL